jgi:ABC-type transporter Mla MlaB component
MSLEISYYNNYYKLKGALNKINLKTFDSHFKSIFEKTNKITIDIASIASIDGHGVMALAKLHNEAIMKNKSLSIIGLGCKELYEHFRGAETAA